MLLSCWCYLNLSRKNKQTKNEQQRARLGFMHTKFRVCVRLEPRCRERLACSALKYLPSMIKLQQFCLSDSSHATSTDMLMRVGNWLCCVVNIIVYLLAFENAINALLLCNELLQWSYLKHEACVSTVSKTLLCSTSLQVVKTGSKVHSFGKREQAIRRNPNVPVIVRGWLHKQVSM